MTIRRAIIGLLLVVGAYYGAVLYILHFSLDGFVLPHTKEDTRALPSPYLTVSSNGNELVIRRYGKAGNGCVIFFPGQHGGIARYQHDLFPALVGEGISVFALSYPGQDGARGYARLSELPRLIETGLTRLEGACRPSDAVFVGRSLGSMVAVYQAVRWHPKGLVLDGIAPSLADAIHTYMENHWYLRPACVLPISSLLRRKYVLGTALDELDSTRVVVFQGSLDVRTPLAPAKRAVAGRANVKFIEVAGARHANVYTKVFSQYIDSIVALLGAKPKNSVGAAIEPATTSRPTAHRAGAPQGAWRLVSDVGGGTGPGQHKYGTLDLVRQGRAGRRGHSRVAVQAILLGQGAKS